MSEMSILSFVAQMGVMHAEMRHLEHEALERACEIIQHEARAAVGTYRLGWPQLAQSTQDDRVRKGFPANEPLLRTGELRGLDPAPSYRQHRLCWQQRSEGSLELPGHVPHSAARPDRRRGACECSPSRRGCWPRRCDVARRAWAAQLSRLSRLCQRMV